MSQSGYTPIQLYRTTTASATPSAGNLSAGELAINLTDEKLFFKNAGGTVKTLASSGTSSIGGSNTQVQYNSSGVLAGSSGLVFDGTNLGIGDSSFAYRLVVGGDVRIAGGGGDLRIQSATGTTTSGGDSTIYNDANDLYFGVNGSVRMYVASGGNVGVGTTSPSSKLTVGGNPPQAGAIAGVGSAGGISLALSDNTNNSLFVKHIAGGAATIGTDPGGQLAFATNGFTVQLNINASGGITSADAADAVGYKGLPQNQRTTTYTLALSDMGKHVFATAGAFTITIPANASVAFPVGSAITIFCGDAAKTLAPAAGVTLIQAGTSNTGNRTLAINALVTLVKLQTNTWVVSGAGLS